MDFEKAHMPSILKSGMRNKFMDFPPFDFEDFIAQMFKDNGYLVEKTSRTGDYGADLVIMEDNIKTAVQIKRYSPNNKVGVQEINQVIGSRDYYKCNLGMVITTSSFTEQGKQLAIKTGVELWDWNRLQKYICDTYLDGKDIYSYFEKDSDDKYKYSNFKFELKKVQYKIVMKGQRECNILYVDMINKTDKNIDVKLHDPLYITKDNSQLEICGSEEGSFCSGVIYAHYRAEIRFLFKADQLPRVQIGDKIIFRWEQNMPEELLLVGDIDSNLVFIWTYELKISSLPPTSSPIQCYVVTACFGVNSLEYEDMIFFRDKILNKYYFGRLVVKIYYVLSKHLIAIFGNNYFVRTLSRCILKGILKPVNYWNNRILSQCWEYGDYDR